MQIAQTKMVRTVYYDGIGIRNINAILHNGGRDEHIKLMLREGDKELLQLSLVHASMPYGNSAIGDALLYHACNPLYIVNAIMDKEYLSIAA